MKYNEFSKADLFIDAAKNKDIDDIACRIFLYLIGNEMLVAISKKDFRLSVTKVANEIGISNQELYNGLSLLGKYELIDPKIISNVRNKLENSQENSQENSLTNEKSECLVVTDLNDNAHEVCIIEIVDNIPHYNFTIPINYNTASVVLRSIAGSILIDISSNESLLNLAMAAKDLNKKIHYSKRTIHYIMKEQLDKEKNIKYILDTIDSRIEEDLQFKAIFKDNI